MSQSLVSNCVHIVFSTKYRQPFITPRVAPLLYGYLGAICKDRNCPPIRINGYRDHVHILCYLSQKIALCKLLAEIKANSSRWIKDHAPEAHNFYWQLGYGAFSVNSAEQERVMAYIENQEAHHQRQGFQDEYRKLLHRYRIPYDERYVWD